MQTHKFEAMKLSDEKMQEQQARGRDEQQGPKNLMINNSNLNLSNII